MKNTRVTYTAGLVIPEFPGETIVDGAVTVEDEKIVWVGHSSDIRESSAAIVDLGEEATIMPGLVDTHVHLAFDGSTDPVAVLNESGTVERFAIMAQSARQMLSAGITTARDLGAPDLLDVKIKEQIEQDRIRGPRLLSVNAPLTVTGGHTYFLGGEAETVDGVRQAVRRARRDGADHIKVMATGGNMTPGTLPSRSQYTQEELDAIVAEAHFYGMKVASHAHGSEGIHMSLLAGVDSLEHFSFIGPRGEEAEVVQLAVDQGTYASRTISAGVGYFHNVLKSPTSAQPGMMRRLVDTGVKLVLGTDSGINNCPHVEVAYALEGMAAYGMTEAEVLRSATSLAAESLGLESTTGRLRPGFDADLIVVSGNPLDSLSALRNLSLVIARGREYIPEFRSTRTWNEEYETPKYSSAADDRSAPVAEPVGI